MREHLKSAGANFCLRGEKSRGKFSTGGGLSAGGRSQ